MEIFSYELRCGVEGWMADDGRQRTVPGIKYEHKTFVYLRILGKLFCTKMKLTHFPAVMNEFTPSEVIVYNVK